MFSSHPPLALSLSKGEGRAVQQLTRFQRADNRGGSSHRWRPAALIQSVNCATQSRLTRLPGQEILMAATTRPGAVPRQKRFQSKVGQVGE